MTRSDDRTLLLDVMQSFSTLSFFAWYRDERLRNGNWIQRKFKVTILLYAKVVRSLEETRALRVLRNGSFRKSWHGHRGFKVSMV